jgi:Flp pilus assembly secretin CpaC
MCLSDDINLPEVLSVICKVFTIPADTAFTISVSVSGPMMFSSRSFKAVALAVLLAAAPLAAVADTTEPISVKVNMARILRISAPAATVIIGNPGVADVTIQDPQTLILTGKSYGSTNLIVLDSMGNPVADTMVTVVQAQADLMTVYMGASRTTLICAPVCQPTIMLGDDTAFSNDASSSASIIEQSARP